MMSNDEIYLFIMMRYTLVMTMSLM